MDKALPPPLRARYRVPTARVDSLSRKVCPPCCSACPADATFWEGEPFASKSPGSRTRPPAVTPYRPYSRCGTNLIECAESARGRRAEWGDVSSSIRYLTVVVDGMWHTRRVCQHANERGSARAHESRLESTRACRVAIASGDTAPAGCGRLWRWRCVNGETNVRIGSDRCVSSTTM